MNLTTSELAKRLDVAVHEVDYWVNSGLITPSVQAAAGQGSRRLFNECDLRDALLVHRLRTANWKPRHIGNALRQVKAALSNPEFLSVPRLIHEGKALLILCRDRNSGPVLLDAASPGQFVMVIALDTLEEETRRSLMRSK